MIIGGLSVVLLCVGFIVLPMVLEWIFQVKSRGSRWWLIAAALVCLVITIIAHQFPREHRMMNFAQHFFGGGVATTLAFVYLRQAFSRQLTFLQELTVLFFLVNGIGALNELLEFSLDQVTNGMYSIDRWDTWYDILANSLGAFVAWSVWKLISKMDKHGEVA